MIARVRQLCHQDKSVSAALMYGSFTKSEGDAFSDIEFYVYLDDAAYNTLDPAGWLAQIGSVALYFVNEFWVGAAIFENLVRGEFHFERTTDMSKIREWKESAGFPPAEAMLILDRTGELATHLNFISGSGPDRTSVENVTWLWHSFLNWMLFGMNVLARGERARALECLWFVQRDLLWFVRVSEATTDHWQTPSKHAEQDISRPAYDRYAACTATLYDQSLEQAYQAAWTWGKELIHTLAREYGFDPHPDLIQLLDRRFAES